MLFWADVLGGMAVLIAFFDGKDSAILRDLFDYSLWTCCLSSELLDRTVISYLEWLARSIAPSYLAFLYRSNNGLVPFNEFRIVVMTLGISDLFGSLVD